jgi:hypothetical protein
MSPHILLPDEGNTRAECIKKRRIPMKTQSAFLGVSLALLLMIGSPASGEEWEKSFDLSLNLTESSYSDSWVGGEAGNVTWAANGNGIFARQMSPKFRLRNTIKLAFGQTVSQDKDDKTWSKPTKSTDKMDLESLGLFTIDAFIEPYAAVRFESQFLDASVDTNKRYINPILLTESAGIARQILKREKDEVLTRLGFAVRQHINRDAYVYEITPTDTTVSIETFTSTDGGIESVTDAKLVLSDKLGYLGKLTLYKAFFFSKKDDFKGTEAEDYWKAVDVNCENTLTASVSKYIQVSLYVQLLYDKQISTKGRLKETLALGLTYKLL